MSLPTTTTATHRVSRPLVPRAVYISHLLRNAGIGGGIVAGSLALGMAGYHGLEAMPWVDALLNAAMILTGEGPMAPMHTTAGKLFASAYALFSGVAFLTAVSVLFAPALQRFLHRFHLEFMIEE